MLTVRSFLTPLLALAALAMHLLASHAAAQPGMDVLSVSATAQRTKTAPGDQFAIAVVLDFKEGWHSWPNKPVLPKGLEDVLAIPTEVSLAKGAAAPEGVRIAFEHAQWPEPHEIESAGFTGEPVKVLSLSGRAVIYVPVMIQEGAKPGKVTLPLAVSYQACDDTTCVAPATDEVSVSFEIGAAGSSVESHSNEELFAQFQPSVFAKILAGAPGDSTPRTDPTPPPPSPGVDVTPETSLFGIKLPDPSSPVGIVVLLLVSMLGGAIMNLTPCVLPVIPIKVMTLTKHASAEGGHSALGLGMWMALGIVVFWSAIGIPMAFVSSALDPSRFIFGTWWVTLLIGLIIVAMGLGIMGMFNLTLPNAVYAINPKADTPWGSFVFGIMTAVLGLPCFGFVAGGLLAAAATMPAVATMSVFVGIGVGMAAPFLVLAAKPELLKKMPRTGPASELVKQVMGLMLLAAAAYFIAVGVQTLVKSKPYVGSTLHWWATAALLALAGLWLALRTVQITKSAARRVVFGVIGLALAGLSVAFAWSETQIQKENYVKLEGAGAQSDSFVTGAWNHYTPARFEKARAEGKIVVADFTADWCLICKTLKRTVLDVDPVKSEIMKSDVVVLEVDVTAEEAPGWAFLRSIGRTGIPTLAIFAPGQEKPEVFNAYTSATVLEALQRARAGAE